MKKLGKKLKHALSDVLENIVVYLAVVGGVLVTKFGPPLVEMFVSNKPFILTKLSLLQICFGFVVAFLVIYRDETKDLKGTQDDAPKLLGRRGNVKWRVQHAFSAGAGWYAITAGFIGASTGGSM